MKSYSSRQIIRILKEHGWELHSVVGSHHQFKHPTRPGRVTVPHPKRDLVTKTALSILKQAGIEL